MRILFWFMIYLLLLGAADIHVRYTDGLEIKCNGWLNWLARKAGDAK